jgi:Ca2+-binding EF-hand superfamily protein
LSPRLVDTDKGGTICTEELGEMFKTLGYNITPEDIGQLIQLVDTDGNGVLDFEEFVSLMEIFLKHTETES